MKKFPWLAFCLIFLLTSCDDSDDKILPIDPDNLLIGHWSYRQSTEGNQSTYQRVDQFIEDEYGFLLDHNNQFIERRNAGWCGTPPMVLENFEGTWEQEENRINISVDNWNGEAHYTWEVIELNEDQLVIKLVWDEYSQGN